eukprot:TRINITY_DN14804_c0_g1_i1.p2 TRINITY_DN14804_c0_g1~~TRINITY_DN14804_c0_g1_i1.p2  ORF type:complete len:124 (-),score=20.84 TRINITY_DN14804_c0_g1_i1:10-381(-)
MDCSTLVKTKGDKFVFSNTVLQMKLELVEFLTAIVNGAEKATVKSMSTSLATFFSAVEENVTLLLEWEIPPPLYLPLAENSLSLLKALSDIEETTELKQCLKLIETKLKKYNMYTKPKLEKRN